MSINADNARECFEENLKLFPDAHTQPEKFNLYQGLRFLADAINDIENEMKTV